MAVINGAFTRTNLGNDDSRAHWRFHMQDNPPIDPVASEREGRAVHCTPREMVEITIPGGLNMPDIYVTEEHRQARPEEYAAFKKGETIATNGIPLEDWPRMDRHMIKHLKSLDFLTVEDMANASDHAIQRIGMGGMNMRVLAKAFLDDVEANALNERLMAETTRKDQQISELSHKVEELGSLLNSVHTEMMRLKDAPSAVATNIPGMSDPIEQAKVQAASPSSSPFDNVVVPKRRGRPPGSKNVAEAEA